MIASHKKKVCFGFVIRNLVARILAMMLISLKTVCLQERRSKLQIWWLLWQARLRNCQMLKLKRVNVLWPRFVVVLWLLKRKCLPADCGSAEHEALGTGLGMGSAVSKVMRWELQRKVPQTPWFPSFSPWGGIQQALSHMHWWSAAALASPAGTQCY